MDMLWWHWIAFGLVLAGLEILTPGGFFVIFFGAGAVVVGLLDLAGLAGPLWVQWLLFTGVSVLAVSLFRKPLLERLRARDDHGPVDSLVGEVAIPMADIAPGAVGRAELRGSGWQARNVGTTTTIKGQRCRVNRIDGLTIYIEPEEGR
jgi:membrane protein implicated in regulation of membrane protease activity